MIEPVSIKKAASHEAAFLRLKITNYLKSVAAARFIASSGFHLLTT